ncbi:MAG: hypothetical protein Fur0010_10210 [Bdellovibrio sp.]
MKKFAAILSLFAISFSTMANEITLGQLGVQGDTVSVRQSAIAGKGDADIFKKMTFTTAALVLGAMLTGRENKATEEHKAMGAAAGTMYVATNVFALPDEGPEYTWYKRMQFVAFPLLAIAPILGGKRADDINKGKASSGLVKEHKTIAGVGAVTYLLSVGLLAYNWYF